MARPEAPLGQFSMEEVVEQALDAAVEIKDRTTSEIIMTIIAARQGHPNYERHIEKILEEQRQILSGEDDRISYPVGTNNSSSRLANALSLPTYQKTDNNLPTPLYEKLSPLGHIEFTDEQKQKAAEAVRAAQTAMSVHISRDANRQEQIIIWLDNGGKSLQPQTASSFAE